MWFRLYVITCGKAKAAAYLWRRVIPNVYYAVCPAAVKGFLMGNKEDGSRKLGQGFFQGILGMDIQVVSRFIQNQKVAGTKRQKA